MVMTEAVAEISELLEGQEAILVPISVGGILERQAYRRSKLTDSKPRFENINKESFGLTVTKKISVSFMEVSN